MRESFDVLLRLLPLSHQWEIVLRKIGGAKTLQTTHASCSQEIAEARARDWADFLGATLTIEKPKKETSPCR